MMRIYQQMKLYGQPLAKLVEGADGLTQLELCIPCFWPISPDSAFGKISREKFPAKKVSEAVFAALWPSARHLGDMHEGIHFT
jgi:hypothetical protein